VIAVTKSGVTIWLERLEMEDARNDEHFEEVLGRLDSLIRRNQPPTQPPPPPLVSEATIPVLTDVYEGAEVLPSDVSVADAKISEQEKLELAVAAVLPMMVEVLEDALIREVRPAMENALKRVLEDLQPQIEIMLRQRLKAPPAQDAED
jgi:hypothetical protein